ncbi:ATP-binding protein [uncultured Bradyrhizobium sp.]|uniref:sensor histidine kinase n=1 Tax=uncultured Bradyrhizobium sp. TaxID=199684 RepID=UPI00261FD3F3|nr:ATP-binding protein [uncultured Bradyrhizobium sp.]
MFQRRLLRTASFRLALLYALLFGISVLLLGAVTFWSTRAALEDQLRRRIEAEMSFLQEEFRSDGIDHLVATVQERTRTPSNLDYFVLDPAGKRLAGDLPMVSGSVGWVRTKSGRDADGKERAESERIEALVSELQGGYRLGVGEDLEQVREIEDTFLTAFASALSVVLLLGIGGGLLLSAGFLRRVETITRTADAIIAGDISRRIERNGSGDDFDRLSATLNAMLDRISGLMENLRQVSTDIAHDLRTPLSRLRQGLEEARWRELTAADYRGVVEHAMEEADAILDTFSALLRIAQIEAGVRCSAFRSVDLSEVMQTVADAYAPTAEESGRTLRIDIAGGVTINGDRDLLVQLFSNLVENALHHTPQGTIVVAQLSEISTTVIAEIADNGSGIPAEERSNVLRRFYRLERSRSTPGSGLGLSMASAIAALHHGTLEIIDNAPGLRAVVRFPSSSRVS